MAAEALLMLIYPSEYLLLINVTTNVIDRCNHLWQLGCFAGQDPK